MRKRPRTLHNYIAGGEGLQSPLQGPCLDASNATCCRRHLKINDSTFTLRARHAADDLNRREKDWGNVFFRNEEKLNSRCQVTKFASHVPKNTQRAKNYLYIRHHRG